MNALLLNHMILVSIINLAFRSVVKTNGPLMNRLDRAMMTPLIKNLNAKLVLSHVDGGMAGAVGMVAIMPA